MSQGCEGQSERPQIMEALPMTLDLEVDGKLVKVQVTAKGDNQLNFLGITAQGSAGDVRCEAKVDGDKVAVGESTGTLPSFANAIGDWLASHQEEYCLGTITIHQHQS